MSSSTYAAAEGSTATITATLSAASGRTVTVGYATSAGTATAGTDYTTAGDTLTFAPGETSKTFSVVTAGDTLDEYDETVTLTLSTPGNATLGTPSTATLTIVDDDPLPTVQFSAASYSFGEGAGTVLVPVTLSAASGRTASFTFTWGHWEAELGTDYTGNPGQTGMLSFSPGQTDQNLSITIVDDSLDEYDERPYILIGSYEAWNGLSGSPVSPNIYIVDNDPPPTVQFSASTYSVSESGYGKTITATLSAASTKTVTVGYATGDDTAKVGEYDYSAASGTLTFNPGVTSQTFYVPVSFDSLDEDDEALTPGSPHLNG